MHEQWVLIPLQTNLFLMHINCHLIFTYQIINLNEATQLLLTKADIAGQTAAYTLHIRHLDQPAEIYTDVSFDIISHQIDDFVSPSGQKMRLPKYFSWIARNDAKQIILNIQAELTAHSAMVMGEVMQVAIYLLVIILAMKFKAVDTSNMLISKILKPLKMNNLTQE